MTRTIKFRGLRTDGKGWVYGDLEQSNYSGCLITVEREIPPTMSEPGGDITTLYHDVSDETVGQFTGMIDGLQNEVWEGDQIVENGEITGTVFYDDNIAAFVIRNSNGNDEEFLSDYENGEGDWHVIGNIHEKNEA